MTNNFEQKQSLAFTETMRGYFTQTQISEVFKKSAFEKAYSEGKENNRQLDFTLTIGIDDIDKFIEDPKLRAKATGYIVMDTKKYPVVDGKFNLFITPNAGMEYSERKEMNYTLFFNDENGNPFTFFGYKSVEKEDGLEVWEETTTLYTYIWKGHREFSDELKDVTATGILRIYIADFMDQLRSMTVSGSNFIEKGEGLIKFMNVFAKNLWEAYAPWCFGTDEQRWNEHIVPLQSNEGVKFNEISKIGFNTKDGLHLEIDRFKNRDSKDVVLLLHGLTTSTDMYTLPEVYNLAQYLGDSGVGDIFSFDWRGSCRYKYNLIPNKFTMDHAILYDIPEAINQIKKATSEDVNIHVICHCVGSITLMSSLAAGLTTNIKSVISNSVSLTPKIKWQSKLKLGIAPFACETILGYPYLSPMIPYMPAGFGKWMFWMERMLRSECKEPACHMVSFMWGWGFPAAFEHRNIHTITHRRLKDLFGGTSWEYYRHMYKMVDHLEAIPYKKEKAFYDLPDSYLENIKNVEVPPILLVSGSKNNIFPGSNKLTFEKLTQIIPEADIDYKEYAEYGHQDMLMGQYCHKEVFPDFMEFLRKHMKDLGETKVKLCK